MKTPRDILLAHHRAAEPKLDAVRAGVLATKFNVGQTSRLSPIKNGRRSETGATPVLLLLWRELILPSRRIWAGLAAVWVLIVAVNVSQRDHSTVALSTASSAPAMMTFRDQQRLLNELLADRAVPLVPDRPKTILPRPRTEILEIMPV